MTNVDLGASHKGSKDGYIQSYFQSRLSFSQIISQVSSYSDPRISIMTDYIISGITDDDIREQMRQMKKQLYADEVKKLRSPTETEKAEVLVSICLYMLGEVTAWYDEFLGITNKQTYDVIDRVEGEENPPDGWDDVESPEEAAEHV